MSTALQAALAGAFIAPRMDRSCSRGLVFRFLLGASQCRRALHNFRFLTCTLWLPMALVAAVRQHTRALAGRTMSTWAPQGGFRLPASSIRVLDSPQAFHDTLVQLAKGARSRVRLAALYLGCQGKEATLLSALGDAVASSPALDVLTLFDHSRGCRGEVPAAVHMHSLASTAPSRVQAAFFSHPKLSEAPFRYLGSKWRETIGVQHMKAYVFDNTVVVSGANLSNDYFTDRADRYWVFEDAPSFADWVAELLEGVAQHSVRLRVGGAGGDAVAALRQAAHPLARPSQRRALADTLQASMEALPPPPPVDSLSDSAVVFPTLQLASVGVRADEAVTHALLSQGFPSLPLHVSTGYFNLTPSYQKALLARPGPATVLTAAPVANGFTGAAGPAGAIPQAYTEFLREFLTAAAGAGRDDVHAREYARAGWTFHAKGLWARAGPGSITAAAPTNTASAAVNLAHAGAKAGHEVCLTAVGSPNYGVRSVQRDLELGLGIVTGHAGLAQAVEGERAGLFQGEGVQDATLETLAAPDRVIQGGWNWPSGFWVHGGWRLLRPGF